MVRGRKNFKCKIRYCSEKIKYNNKIQTVKIHIKKNTGNFEGITEYNYKSYLRMDNDTFRLVLLKIEYVTSLFTLKILCNFLNYLQRIYSLLNFSIKN